ncbi:hypothetical protein [Aureivirga sp. CE67]|uniref:hypothetical protein n=1 Tax=Aureivirga sp. CE67 TaxID=1788983 RepID=UPI0018CBEB00|nr:hypothetical protein [Aureivirga sp. CE67]
MKKLLIFLFILTSNLSINAQSKTVDSLIEELDNDQINGTCNYVWVLKVDSKAADTLIEMGKPITQKLISFLEDPNKGIIIHYILSEIWYEKYSMGPVHQDFTILEGYTSKYICNELYFYTKHSKMVAKKQDLHENKKKWIEKIKLSSQIKQ